MLVLLVFFNGCSSVWLFQSVRVAADDVDGVGAAG